MGESPGTLFRAHYQLSSNGSLMFARLRKQTNSGRLVVRGYDTLSANKLAFIIARAPDDAVSQRKR